MIELLAAAQEEAEASIETAYQDGYKAGVLAVAPEAAGAASELEYWKGKALEPRIPWWSIPAAGAAGILIFELIKSLCGG